MKSVLASKCLDIADRVSVIEGNPTSRVARITGVRPRNINFRALRSNLTSIANIRHRIRQSYVELFGSVCRPSNERAVLPIDLSACPLTSQEIANAIRATDSGQKIGSSFRPAMTAHTILATMKIPQTRYTMLRRRLPAATRTMQARILVRLLGIVRRPTPQLRP